PGIMHGASDGPRGRQLSFGARLRLRRGVDGADDRTEARPGTVRRIAGTGSPTTGSRSRGGAAPPRERAPSAGARDRARRRLRPPYAAPCRLWRVPWPLSTRWAAPADGRRRDVVLPRARPGG